MSDNTELVLKINTLEVEQEYTKKTLDSHTKALEYIQKTVNTIESRLDKQNGTIPHIKENLGQLTKEFKDFNKIFQEKELSQITESSGIKTKVKLIWLGLGLASVGLVKLVVHLLFGM